MDAFPAYLLLPLLSSILYVFGALLLRRSADFGVGVWRTAFVTNIVTAIVFSPLWLFGGTEPPLTLLWQPAIVAALFLAGQILGLLAITRGDVSVATPVMGIKLILVAAFVTGVQKEVVPFGLWVAALLSMSAIAFLNLGFKVSHRRIGFTIAMAALGACCFALFDVLISEWTPAWGIGRFLPWVMGIVLLYSTVFLIPFFGAPLRAIPRPAWGWLLGGASFVSLQGLGLITTLGVFGNATAVNVVYSSRGLWSVMAVWWIGHWFRNPEQELGVQVLRWRMLGACLMTAAIVLALSQQSAK